MAVWSFALAYWQYLYRSSSLVFSKTVRYVLFALRFFLLFLLGILLLEFYSRYVKREYIKPALVVAVDNSQSMIKAKDSVEVKNFFRENFSEFVGYFQDKMDVQVFTFGEQIRFNPDSILFNENKSNAEGLMNAAQQVLGDKPISAMLIISDGIFNEGMHPVSLTEGLEYPVYVLATGDTAIYKDVCVKKILHPKQVYLGNDFVTEILVNGTFLKNEKIKISVSENNTELFSKEIFFYSDVSDVQSVSFQLPANKGGYHTYKVQASVVKGEKNIQNNTAYFVVNVIENKTKVLILYSAPHPDISAISQVLKANASYEVESIWENNFTKSVREYDVVIYHSPGEASPLLNKCLQLAMPVWVISGNASALQNRLLRIQQIIPQQRNEIECYLNTSFSAFALTDAYKDMTNQLPILLSPYGNYSPIGESEVLFYQKINNVLTDLPLFYFTNVSGVRYAVFLGDGLWRWKMTDYQLHQNIDWFSHLITQSIHYLTIRRDKNPFKVYVPAAINENEPLQLTAEFYNESMQSITEPDVVLNLTDSKKNEYKFVFNKATGHYFLNAGILPAGEYSYKAFTQYKGKDYTQSGKIHILPFALEKNSLVAQHSLLKLMANKTGGKFYLLNQTDALKNDLLNNETIQTIVTESEKYQYWIDNKIWFLTLILLSLCEWIIRRWYGVI